jgi:TP901 family phage tail tape measure protein
MAERQVAVKLIAVVDQYVSAMAAASTASGTFSRQTQANFSRIGSQMQNVGRTMTMAVSVPIAGLGVAATVMSRNFEQAFARMVGLANVPAQQVDKLKQSVLDLAGETGRAPIELADALYEAASAGLNADQAMQAVTVSAKAAAAGMGTTDDVAGLVASAISAYGSANMDAAEAVDILTSTIREGRAAPEELAGAMGRMLAPAAELGISLNEVGAAVAYVSNVFGDTYRTVNGVQDMFIKLQAPAESSIKVLKEMGTSYEELRAAIDEDGLLGALDLLRTHGFDENTQALRKLMPDTHGYNALLTLLNDNAGTLDRTLGRLEDSSGSLEMAWSNWLKTDGAKIAQAWGEIQAALIELGNIILPIAATVASALADIAQAFADLPAPVQGVILAIGALAALAGPMVWFAGTMVKNWGYIVTAMKGAELQADATAAAQARAQAAAGVPPLGPPQGPIGPKGQGMQVGGPGLLALLGLDATMSSRTHIEQAQGLEDEENPNYGSNPFSRFGNRLLGRELPTARLAPNFGHQPSGMLADMVFKQETGQSMDLNSLAKQFPDESLTAQRDALREAGEAATIYEGRVVKGAEATELLSHWSAVLTSEQDHYARQTRHAMEVADEQYESFMRGQEAAETYRNVLASPEWGQTGIEAAGTALGAFNEYLFGGYAQIATSEAAMDGLAESLKEVGTVGTGGLKDLNLATEEGRAAFQSLQEVAGAFEPQLAEAVSAADGSVTTLQGSIQGLRDGFIQMAVDAGIPAEEAAALADAIGLIPENAQTFIDLQGAEEAQLKLSLMSGAIALLEEKDQTAIALLIADEQFTAAAALAEEKLAALDSTTATPTVGLNDQASDRVRSIQGVINSLTGKTVTVTTNHVTNYVAHVLSGGPKNVAGGRVVNSAEGRYVGSATTSHLAETGPEAVIPLTRPDRIRALYSDPRISRPIMAALGGSSSSGGTTTSLTWVQNAPIYGVDDLEGTINGVLRERDAMARAGRRHR